MRWIIIGKGWASRTHIPALAKEDITVCTRDYKLFSPKSFDAAIVATPNPTHEEIGTYFSEIPILFEKPFCHSYQSAQRTSLKIEGSVTYPYVFFESISRFFDQNNEFINGSIVSGKNRTRKGKWYENDRFDVIHNMTSHLLHFFDSPLSIGLTHFYARHENADECRILGSYRSIPVNLFASKLKPVQSQVSFSSQNAHCLITVIGDQIFEQLYLNGKRIFENQTDTITLYQKIHSQFLQERSLESALNTWKYMENAKTNAVFTNQPLQFLY